jgi:GT2 family glycosyltransferase
VLATQYPNFEVVLADNASYDGSIEFVKLNFPCVKIVQHPTNLGYSNGVNLALSVCNGEFIAVLNNDVEVETTWLVELINALKEDNTIGIVSPKKKLLDDPGFLDGAGGVQNIFGYGWDRGQGEMDGKYENLAEVLHPPGAAFLVRRELVKKYGFLLNPGFFYLFEDADLGLRSWLAGYKVIYVPRSVIRHARGPSIGGHSYRTARFMYAHVLASYYEVFGLRFMIEFLPVFFAVRLLYGLLWLKVKRSSAFFFALLSAVFHFLSSLPKNAALRLIVRRNTVIDSRTLLDRFSDEIGVPTIVLPYMAAYKKFLWLTGFYIEHVMKAKPISRIRILADDRFQYVYQRPLDEIYDKSQN